MSPNTTLDVSRLATAVLVFLLLAPTAFVLAGSSHDNYACSQFKAPNAQTDPQQAQRWQEADAEIAKLKDRTLIGHVLAQRYLHPNKYRSRYKELYDCCQVPGQFTPQCPGSYRSAPVWVSILTGMRWMIRPTSV